MLMMSHNNNSHIFFFFYWTLDIMPQQFLTNLWYQEQLLLLHITPDISVALISCKEIILHREIGSLTLTIL